MNISLNWLREYVDISLEPSELAETLTMLGLEVESLEDRGAKYANFVVGKVLERTKHPNANHLSVCSVDVGGERLQIVCGAPNVAAGQKVVVARVGAVIPRNQHDPKGLPFRLERTKIRGVESSGMICSEFELDLGDDKEGILVLDQSAEVGTPFAEFLGLSDVILSIGVTPNRPDCLSHIGIAREVAAATRSMLRLPRVAVQESDLPASSVASVVVEDLEGCPRYSARVIRGVKIAPSPRWFQQRLEAVGLRPINNVVDVTNYVMLEFGHPLHAFDLDRLVGHRIVVRRAKDGEYFVTLDGKGRSLDSDVVLICDEERGVAIAGIMGGANSEISSSTTNILLESAYFAPWRIRRASRRLGLSTDASQRFERGADPNGTIVAINRAAQLIAELAGGEVLSGVIDVYPEPFTPRHVSLRVSRTNDILGTTLHAEEIQSILERLGFRVSHEAPDVFDVEVPTFRVDIEREIDLIEEVARLYGFGKIPDQLFSQISFASEPPGEHLPDTLRDFLTSRGYYEVYTNSMQEEELARLWGIEPILVRNPLSRDMAALRTSLLPGLLQVVKLNFNVGRKSVQIFEIGKVFRKATEKNQRVLVDEILEEEMLGIAIAGVAERANWYSSERLFDLFDLKGEVESLFEKIFLDKVHFVYYSIDGGVLQPTVFFEHDGVRLGYIGKVKGELKLRFDLEYDVYFGELNISLLEQYRSHLKRFRELPKYPSVVRDVSFLVNADVSAEQLMGAIERTGLKELQSVHLFDLYEGERIPKGKKSMAFSLEFRSDERTLTEEIVDKMVQRIIENACSIGAELRSASQSRVK